MTWYKRRLPHWHPDDVPLFVTWRLYGSLSKPTQPKSPNASWLATIRQFNASPGPRWLERTDLAELVANALHFAETQLRLYHLLAWVIMPTHVHILIEPKAALARITKSVKWYTAREANRVLQRSGPFWQAESYDHWVRDERELEEILNYIEYNPVEAGLVLMPENWPWSSAALTPTPAADS